MTPFLSVRAARGWARVLRVLEWLRTKVGASDVGMVFLAGHGLNDADGNYYFLPVDADLRQLPGTAVVDSQILDALAGLAGRGVFFIDTCHAGNAIGGRRAALAQDRFARDLAGGDSSVVVLASSGRDQSAFEKKEWGNGAFTLALREGISGRADVHKTGRVTLKGLDFYVAGRVKVLTQGQQTPVTISPSGFSDFDLAGDP